MFKLKLTSLLYWSLRADCVACLLLLKETDGFKIENLKPTVPLKVGKINE